MIDVLDHGTVEIVSSWGSDETIIESARMSTNKGFEGWDKDAKLLSFLHKNHHLTPFEMCGATFEIEAPIFVFREWHRHRTQSYNEMSARYIPLPNVNYSPTIERIIDGATNAGKNKQAQGFVPLNEEDAKKWLQRLESFYSYAQIIYEEGLKAGIPKEIARLVTPVGRYSKMRASANLRNWLQFLSLREAPNAQYEIRMYANAINVLLCDKFPRVMALHNGEKSPP